MESSIESLLHCCICEYDFSDINIPLVLECGHTFCSVCVLSMYHHNLLDCPKCRHKLTKPFVELPRNYMVLGILQAQPKKEPVPQMEPQQVLKRINTLKEETETKNAQMIAQPPAQPMPQSQMQPGQPQPPLQAPPQVYTQIIKGYQTVVHPHFLFVVHKNKKWSCNGAKLQYGCLSGFNQRDFWPEVKRVKCQQKGCDFDLCERCLGFYLVKERVTYSERELFNTKVHPHPLALIDRDSGWYCNGKKLKHGCLSGIKKKEQSYGKYRYRCVNEECDFDLCSKCLYNNEVFLTGIHPHALEQDDDEVKWSCDGEANGGCLNGFSVPNYYTDFLKYSCKQCGFCLCLKCLIMNKINSFN